MYIVKTIQNRMHRVKFNFPEPLKALINKALRVVVPGTTVSENVGPMLDQVFQKSLKRSPDKGFSLMKVVPLRIERRPAASEATILSVVLRDHVITACKCNNSSGKRKWCDVYFSDLIKVCTGPVLSFNTNFTIYNPADQSAIETFVLRLLISMCLTLLSNAS